MMELPTVEEEIPEPYTREDLQALFKAMTPEERVRYTFFLDTACREKEVAHAQWADLIDGKYWVRKKTFKARGGKERQFSPKSHETRLIPLTRELMDMLNARRKSSKSQWIFPNEWGDPEGHFLRKFKAVAKEAGLNCGECETTISEGRFTKHPAEVSCLTSADLRLGSLVGWDEFARPTTPRSNPLAFYRNLTTMHGEAHYAARQSTSSRAARGW
jgi:integrase